MAYIVQSTEKNSSWTKGTYHALIFFYTIALNDYDVMKISL